MAKLANGLQAGAAREICRVVFDLLTASLNFCLWQNLQMDCRREKFAACFLICLKFVGSQAGYSVVVLAGLPSALSFLCGKLANGLYVGWQEEFAVWVLICRPPASSCVYTDLSF